MTEYYDRNGDPMPMEAWLQALSGYGKRVAHTKTKMGIDVSTVWLGINHQFGPNKPPLIFETLCFPGADDGKRYTTEIEALKGHLEFVEKYGGPQ